MKEINDISSNGEIWKTINEFDKKIHKSWVISNFGRVFRLSYETKSGQIFPLKEVTKFVQPHCDFQSVIVGIGSNRKKLPVPLMVKYLFDDNFVYIKKRLTHTSFEDGDIKNNHVDNIKIYYSLIHYPDLIFEFYKILSEGVENKKFDYLTSSEIKDLNESYILESWNTFTSVFELPHTLKPTGAAVLKLISDSLKNQGESGGINSFLIYNGLQPHKSEKISIDNFKYISNLGVFCDSRVECFVKNVYEYLGFVDGDFKKKNLSKLTNNKDLFYNPVPDEYFMRPQYDKLIVSETFGVSPKINPKGKIQKKYVEKAKLKEKLYQKFDFILIDLWVHGLTLREVLDLMNRKLISLGLIDTEVIFHEELLPNVEIINLKDSLLKFKEDFPLFDLKILKEKNPRLYGIFIRHCEDLYITPVEYLDQRIFFDIETPVGEGGFLSMKAYKRNILTIKQTKSIIKKYNLTSAKGILEKDSALYWRIFRMCRTKKVPMSKFLKPLFGKTRINQYI